MLLQDIMKQKNMSVYRLSKLSGVPYTTINEICTGKTHLENCSAATVYHIAKACEVSMESLVAPCLEKRIDFELFKSNTCHRLKEMGDIQFLITLLENDDIRKLYQKKWYAECLYLLAMLDYISRKNNVPLCDAYDDIRNKRLQETLFPASVVVEAKVRKNNTVKQEAIESSIPEFIRFNIVESEVYNVV